MSNKHDDDWLGIKGKGREPLRQSTNLDEGGGLAWGVKKERCEGVGTNEAQISMVKRRLRKIGVWGNWPYGEGGV